MTDRRTASGEGVSCPTRVRPRASELGRDESSASAVARGEESIEVTEEMISAAYWTLRHFSHERSDTEETLTRIYRQMHGTCREGSGANVHPTGSPRDPQ